VKEVTLYTVVKEKRVVAQDHIDFYERRCDSVPVYNLGGDSPTKEFITVQQIPVEHRVFYRRGDKQEYYIAMTEDVREVFGLELKALNDYKELCRLQEERLNGALKTNETLVKYKNDLLAEVEALTDSFNTTQETINKINTLTFWQRLKFLFTGVLL